MPRARSTTRQSNVQQSVPGVSVQNALVFISHDTRDAAIAEAFSSLLSNVTCGMLKSFRSSDKSGAQGLEYGSEWYPEIMSRLERATDVVCLLTEQSLGRPWILYEAGVAKGKLGTPVHGLALGVPLAQAATGPFAQFQNCDGDSESITKLVIQLVKRLPNAEPQKEIIEMQVATFQSTLDGLIKKSRKNSRETEVKDTTESTTVKLFEEVKVMFQELPGRMERRVVSVLDPSQRSKRERSRGAKLEFIHNVAPLHMKPHAVWLLAISEFQAEAPWLFELGMIVYHALKDSKLASNRAFDEFNETVREVFQSPLIDKNIGNEIPDFLVSLSDVLAGRLPIKRNG